MVFYRGKKFYDRDVTAVSRSVGRVEGRRRPRRGGRAGGVAFRLQGGVKLNKTPSLPDQVIT